MKNKEEMLFVVKKSGAYDFHESMPTLELGIFQKEEDAIEFLEDTLFKDVILSNSLNHEIRNTDECLKIIEQEQHYYIEAMPLNCKLDYTNSVQIYSVNLYNSGIEDFQHEGKAALGRTYSSCKKRIAREQKDIQREMEKDNKNIIFIKNMQENVEKEKKRMAFIETFFGKEKVQKLEKDYKAISAANTESFILSIEEKIHSHNPELLKQHKDIINKNLNSGIMKEAFHKAKNIKKL